MPEKQYMVFVDSDRCMGCRTCEIACKQENNVPVGPQWIKLTEVEKEEDGRIKVLVLPMLCVHCGDPYCAAVCPTEAIEKDNETGIVVVNQEKCIGCRMCLIVCPFGAPQFGKDGYMQKCILCKDCIANGEEPACARGCPAEAMTFGTVEEISAKLREKGVIRIWKYMMQSTFSGLKPKAV